MKCAISVAMLSVCVVLSGMAAEKASIQLLTTGLHHGDEVKVEGGPDWWSVFPEGDGWTLHPAPITITIAHDAIVDAPGEATGKQVTVPQESAPLILVRGLQNAVAGPLNTVAATEARGFLYPGQIRGLGLPEQKSPALLRLVALGTVEERPEHGALVFAQYQLKLRRGSGAETKHQTLVSRSKQYDDTRPLLLWAGDLDRDGHVDLLMDLSDHYNVSHLALFLSGSAKPGEFVGLAAEFVTTGC